MEVGSAVQGFVVGDKVFSRLPTDQIGAFADYVAVSAEAVAKMPEGLTFTEAASIPLTALTASQALRRVWRARSYGYPLGKVPRSHGLYQRQ